MEGLGNHETSVDSAGLPAARRLHRSSPLPERLPELQLPRQLHVQREQDGQRQDWLLVIQREEGRLRWSLLDLMGIPQARQLFDGRQWHADGLLPLTRPPANCSPPCSSRSPQRPS